MDRDQRRLLLQIVRETVRDAAEAGPNGSYKDPPARTALDDDDDKNAALFALSGAFVTLHDASGGVRGCVGTTASVRPLVEVVIEMARAASMRDPRFSPVEPHEVDGLELEISVLEPLQQVDSTDEVEIGRHGLVIEGLGRRGLLLPQVATERDWSQQVFAEQTCRKAGLPPHAYLEKNVEMYRFCAEVFNEKEETPSS